MLTMGIVILWLVVKSLAIRLRLTEAKLVACLAHIRRKFVDAKKIHAKVKTGKVDVANIQGKYTTNIQDTHKYLDNTPKTIYNHNQ